MVNYIYSKNVPEYVVTDIAKFGYKINRTKDDTINLLGKQNLIIYENELDFLTKNINSLGDRKALVVIDHHFLHHEKMSQLDDIVGKHKITFLGTQYLKNLYKNIECYAQGSSELWCYHDFIITMIQSWHSQRKPTVEKLFLFLKSPKPHPERKAFVEAVSNACVDDILSLNKTNDPIEFQNNMYDRKDEFIKWLKETFGNEYLLSGFGTGTPRFDLYDRVFAELVIETFYRTPTVHVTEKTWRPIASRVPCLLLLNAPNLEYLEQLGYRLEPSHFYSRLKMCSTIEQVVETLKTFVNELKQDSNLQEQMTESCEYNYQHFWKMKSKWSSAKDAYKNIFGYSPIEELMDKLNQL